MNNNKLLQYLLFGLLYFTQGIIVSYFTALNALYFLSRGITMTKTGIFGMIIFIPFVLKIFMGILSDRVNLFSLGYRKPYIVIGLTIQSICLILMSFIDPGKYFPVYVLVSFILLAGMALYDVCTDGLALDTTAPEEEGVVQIYMVSGRSLGVVVTASIMGILAEKVSWSAVFWMLAVTTLIPLFFLWGIKEAERNNEQNFNWSAFASFKKIHVVFLALVGFVFAFITTGTNQIVNPFLKKIFNLSISEAGLVTTIWGIGAVAGGVLGGYLYKRIGRSKTLFFTILICMISIVLLSLTVNMNMARSFVLLFGIACGARSSVFNAFVMHFTDSRIAASMYAIMMAVLNIASAIGVVVSGLLSDIIGYRFTIALLGILILLAIPMSTLIFRNTQNSTQLKSRET